MKINALFLRIRYISPIITSVRDLFVIRVAIFFKSISDNLLQTASQKLPFFFHVYIPFILVVIRRYNKNDNS